MMTSRWPARLVLPALMLACAGTPAALAQAPEAAKPAATENQPTLVVGSPAPALAIAKWVKGDAISSFQQGKIYVVEFWATWCGPCIASMPHLTELQQHYRDKGLTIIGVTREDTRGNTLEAVEKMVEQRGNVMGYTVAFDDGRKTSDAYMKAANQRGIPTAFVVDQAGKIAFIGHPSELDLVIDRLVAGTWDAVKGPQLLRDIAQQRADIRELAGTEPVEALKRLAAFEKEYPALSKGMDNFRYWVQIEAGDKTGAAATGAKIVDAAIASKNAEALNEWAWTIVDPDGEVKFRDVPLATRAAEEANRLTDGKDPGILDTLARCHWLAGDKGKAIDLQKKAVDAAKGQMKEQLQATLREFEAAAKN